MVEIVLLILAVGYFARRGRRAPTGDALATLLAGAAAAGIITTAQREQLVAYAATHQPQSTRLGGAAWLGVFAGLFVVAGVSLLIARNWEEFGPLLRIGAFLVVLLAVGEAAIRTQGRSVAVSVPLELLWFFLPLLGIGLYGQTFQLSGDPVQPFLAWLAVSAPLAWLSRRSVVATVHTAALVFVLFMGNYVVEPMTMIIGSGTGWPTHLLALDEKHGSLLAWALSIAILLAIAVQSLRLLPRAHRHQFVGVWAVWLWAMLLAPTPLHVGHPGWLVLATLGLTTLWLVVLIALDTSFEERATVVAVWLATIYGLTFTWHMTEPASGTASEGGRWLIEIVVAAALAGVLALPARRLSPLASWAWAGKALLVVPLLAATLYLGQDVQRVWQAAAIMNVVLVVAAIGFMWHGSLVHETAQINLGVMVLVGVLITRFLDVFGSMLQSGMGFIVAGLLLAGLSWALERTRRRLIAGQGLTGEVTP
jgi:uncharacterized membrane protein